MNTSRYRYIQIWALAFLGFISFVRAQEEVVPVEAEVMNEAPEEALEEEPVALGEGAGGSSISGNVTPWARFGEDYAEGLLDVLLPVYYSEKEGTLIFTNLRTAFNDISEEELNIGLGIRQVVGDKNVILGANAFYDSRWTESESQFNQLGLGAEVLTTWIDGRINGYFPENTQEKIDTFSETYLTSSSTRRSYRGYGEGFTIYEEERVTRTNNYQTDTFEIYDVPLEGFDAEIGVKLPLSLEWLETRVFGGYYSFQTVWDGNLPTDNDIEGFKGRAEFRIHDRILIDAEVFEDDRLFGSDYLISARLSLPFDLGAIAHGENPFKKQTQNVSGIRSRLTEMVMRDPHIQIRTETDVTTSTFQESFTRRRNYVILNNVIFVDGDNPNDPNENGSFENPFDKIQEGVTASDDRNQPNVFVDGSDQPYSENVEVSESINLYGGGLRFGTGTTPGDGRTPIVQSASDGPFIMEFEGGQEVFLGGFTFSGAGSTPVLGGVSFVNIPRVMVTQNRFENLPIGLAAIYDSGFGGSSFNMVVSDNTFVRNGIGVGAVLNSDKGMVTIQNNRMENNLLGIGAVNFGSAEEGHVKIIGNQIIYNDPIDITDIALVDSLLGSFFGGGLPDEIPVPAIGGIFVGAIDGNLKAEIRDNQVIRPLLGITAVSLDLFGGDTNLDLRISNNVVKGGGIADLVDLFLGSFIDLGLPDEAGLAGITLLAIGPDAHMNDAVISGNKVLDNLLGISVIAAGGAEAEGILISNNRLKDNILGITGIGILDGRLNDLAIVGNNVYGGGTRRLVPIIEDFLGPIPFEVPDFSLAGITLVGVSTDHMNDILIAGNTVSDSLLGVSALGFGSVDMNDLIIVDNMLTHNFSGILVYGNGSGVDMNGLIVDGNTVSGAGTGFIADLLGAPPGAFPDWGLAGIAVVGVDEANMNMFSITNNTVTDQLIGIGVLGFGDANLNDGIISGNSVEYGLVGIGAASLFGSEVNDLSVTDNSLVGEGTGIPGFPIGPVTVLGDKPVAGVGIVALDGDATGATVTDNEISNNQIGVVILETGSGDISGEDSSSNTFDNNDTDEVIIP